MKFATLLLISMLSMTYGYHILCMFPVPTRSHNNLAKGIVDALLKAGHEVTWATPYPIKNPVKGLTIIDVSVTLPIIEAIDMTVKRNAAGGAALAKECSRNISIAAMTDDLKHAVVHQQFDAVVTEMFFSEVDTGYAAVQQVPWILLSGIAMQPPLQALVDEVRSVPIIPMIFNSYPIPMNFWQRAVTTFIYIMMSATSWLDMSSNAALYKEMFGPLATARGVPLPPFEDALHNISVVFINSHPSYAHAQSLPPNVVEIAGYHIDEHTPALPKDLQDLLDSSPQGVVYFSMGSVVKSANFPEQTRKDLLKIFGSLPYTVLWKFEDKLEGLPKNVIIRQWMPQASILAHPNVKVFITHGGMLSTLEALHYGVPLLALPVFGDQPANADSAVHAGYALKVSFRPDMGEELNVALNEILTNDSYYKQVKLLSKLFNKRPVAPSKLISHYIELAIESKGAFHLRSKSRLYKWYERCMLDQAAVSLIVLYLLYAILKKAFKVIVNKVKGTKDLKIKDKKKQKKN